MRVYFDNCIVSGEIRGDLQPSELVAVQELRRLHEVGRIEIVTSRETQREQARTRDEETKRRLTEATADFSMVARDHELLGAAIVPDRTGSIVSNRAFTDIVGPQLFDSVKSLGLEASDARHLMYAKVNGCAKFITTDPDFIRRTNELESLCQSIQIRTPATMVTELKSNS